MPTQCISEQLEFEGFVGRRVVAAFDGGAITSDAGALLLREADRSRLEPHWRNDYLGFRIARTLD